MLRSYLEAVTSATTGRPLRPRLAFVVASVLLGLIVGVGSLMVTDYLVRMAALGQAPDVTGSTIRLRPRDRAGGRRRCSHAQERLRRLHERAHQAARASQEHGCQGRSGQAAAARRGLRALASAAAAGVLVGLGLALALVSAVVSATAQSRTTTRWSRSRRRRSSSGSPSPSPTVLVSALLPARRIGRVSIVQAMRQGDDDCRAAKRPGVLARIMGSGLGIEFQLAASSLRARRRGMRTANVSIALAVLAFVTLLNFETLFAPLDAGDVL